MNQDELKPFPWDQIRKRPEPRETAKERREREREAAENFNHDPLGLVKPCAHKSLDDMRCCNSCGEYLPEAAE